MNTALHPASRSLWVSVTLIWMMASGSCQASRRAADLLTPREEPLAPTYLLLALTSLGFSLVLAVGAWGAWRWKRWGYIATIAALACIVVLNVARAASADWNHGEANLFGLLSLALLIPAVISFKDFLSYRRQMATLEGAPNPGED